MSVFQARDFARAWSIRWNTLTLISEEDVFSIVEPSTGSIRPVPRAADVCRRCAHRRLERIYQVRVHRDTSWPMGRDRAPTEGRGQHKTPQHSSRSLPRESQVAPSPTLVGLWLLYLSRSGSTEWRKSPGHPGFAKPNKRRKPRWRAVKKRQKANCRVGRKDDGPRVDQHHTGHQHYDYYYDRDGR